MMHYSYLNTLVKGLREWSEKDERLAQRLFDIREVVLAIVMLDLSPAEPILKQYYSNREGGKPPKDPPAMLRSLVLMTMLKETSFIEWAKTLRGRPELELLSGFDPDDTSAYPTYYDFCYRLLDGPYQKRGPNVVRPSELLKGTTGRFRRRIKRAKDKKKEGAEKKKRTRETDEELAQKEGATKRAVEQAMATFEEELSESLRTLLNDLLMRCAVVPSAQLGLLGDLKNLIVSGDGSLVESNASCRGKALCDCYKNGDRKCDCERSFTDPTADWGWDDYRKRFVFGHRIHLLCAKYLKRDLPLYLSVQTARSADVTVGVKDLVNLVKHLREQLPKAKIDIVILDAGYDAMWMYRLIVKLGAKPVIVLNLRNTKTLDIQGLKRTKDGVPLCPEENVPMRYCGKSRTGDKLMYCCACRISARINGKHGIKIDMSRCPRDTPCKPETVMGPMVRIPIDDDPRMNCQIQRGSKLWKTLYKERTCDERFFSFAKKRGKLSQRPYRREHLVFINAFCQSLHKHAMAWVSHRFGTTRPKSAHELLDWVEALIPQFEDAAA